MPVNHFFLTKVTIFSETISFTRNNPTMFVDEVIDYLNVHALYREEPAFQNYYQEFKTSHTEYSSMALAMKEVEIAVKKAGGLHSKIFNYQDNLLNDNLAIDYPSITPLDYDIIKIKLSSTSNLVAQYYLKDEHFTETLSTYENALIEYVNSHSINGIILDLRDNHGGDLPMMYSALNFLFDNGTLLAFINSHNEEYAQIEMTDQGIIIDDLFPIKHRLKKSKCPQHY